MQILSVILLSLLNFCLFSIRFEVHSVFLKFFKFAFIYSVFFFRECLFLVNRKIHSMTNLKLYLEY